MSALEKARAVVDAMPQELRDTFRPTDRDVSSKYGAPMGRPRDGMPKVYEKLHLYRVPLDSGGYDKGGAYWGIGEPLYCAYSDDGFTDYLRASGREAAKAELLRRNPTARFYR